MGCHVWFYVPIEVTASDLKRLALEELKMFLDGESESKSDTLFVKRWIRRIKSDRPIWRCAVYLFQSRVKLINNKHYIINMEYLDLFRVDNYPNIRLNSMDETLAFIDNNKQNLGICKENFMEKVKEFWDKCPDGFIKID